MNILHLLAAGGVGGIEVLCNDLGKFSRNNNFFCFVWRGGPIRDEMNKAGMETYVIGLKNKRFSLIPYHRILEICITNRIDAVICHHSAPLLLFYFLKLKKEMPNMSFFLYAHCHCNDLIKKSDPKKSWLYKLLFRKSLWAVNKVFAISVAVKKSIESEFGYNRNNIDVVYNGIDINRFTALKSHKNPMVEIVFVGRIVKEKGVQILIEAIKRAKSAPSSYHCSIAGNGPYIKNIEELINKYGLQDRISLLGERRDVHRLLSESDVFVHPAVWHEGFGITIIEALAAGLVCIASDIDAIPELIRHEENGYLFEKGNVTMLADKLDTIIRDYDTKNTEAIKRAARISAQRFDIHDTVKKLDELLENEIIKQDNSEVAPLNNNRPIASEKAN